MKVTNLQELIGWIDEPTVPLSGDLYNFKLDPSLTLGCGSWGDSSVSGNVTIHHLENTRPTH